MLTIISPRFFPSLENKFSRFVIVYPPPLKEKMKIINSTCILRPTSPVIPLFTNVILKKIYSRRLALLVIQKNLRNYLKMKTWPWWKMWSRVKPLLNVANIEEELAVRFTRH